MRRRGFSLVEVGVVVAIMGILAAILYPVLRPRPLLWSRTVMAPQRFKNAELGQVVLQFHRELYAKRKMSFLKDTKWGNSNLSRRRITLNTRQEMTLKEVLALVGKKGGVVFQGGGGCGPVGIRLALSLLRQCPNSGSGQMGRDSPLSFPAVSQALSVDSSVVPPSE